MATDALESGPLPGQKFTQARWAQTFGANAGIVGDTDGSAFTLTLPPSTTTAQIGSATIESVAIVGGYPLIIPAGETQDVVIPDSTNPTVGRTDLIVARFNSGTFTTAPGPCRLVVIPGTEGSANPSSHNTTLPSPVDLVLYQVTRKQGQSLNQATVVDRRSRTGWHYLMPAGAPLPQTAPLGSRATRDSISWCRDFVGSAVDWVQDAPTVTELTGTAAFGGGDSGWPRQAESLLVREGKKRWLHLVVERGSGSSSIVANGSGGGFPDALVGVLADADKPRAGQIVPMHGFVITTGTSTWTCGGDLRATGNISLNWMAPNITLPEGGLVRMDATWWVA